MFWSWSVSLVSCSSVHFMSQYIYDYYVKKIYYLTADLYIEMNDRSCNSLSIYFILLNGCFTAKYFN